MLGLDESLAGVAGLYLQSSQNFSQDLRVSPFVGMARAPVSVCAVFAFLSTEFLNPFPMVNLR